MKLLRTAAALAVWAAVVPVAPSQNQDADPARMDATIAAAKAEKNYDRLDAAAAFLARERDYHDARKLEDAALQIREAAMGRKSRGYAQGLIKIADLERAQQHQPQAIKLYHEALAEGDSPEVLGALIALGLEELRLKKAGPARDYFERAVHVADTPDWRTRALLMLAVAAEKDKRKPEIIEGRYKEALSAAAEDSAQRVAAQWCYAKYLESQNRHDESAALLTDRQEVLKRIRAKAAEATKRSAATSNASKVTGGVTKPVPVYHPQPDYTDEARQARYQGTVLMYVEIGPDGKVAKELVMSPLGLGLDEKALDSVSLWRFQPAMLNGQPVTAQAQVEVNFRLM